MKKKIYVLAIIFLNSMVAFSQIPNWDWAQQSIATTPSGYNYGYGTATDKSGNVYVTGSFTGTTMKLGSITFTNAGGSDYFIAKYDPNGVLLWAKRGGGTGNDGGLAMAIDTSGNLFVTGYFASSTITFGTAPFLTNVSSGTADIFVVKYDQSGNAIWAKSAGSTGDDKGTSISTDASGNVLVTGTYSGSFVYGSTTLGYAGNTDVFVAKYNPSGGVMWAASGGGSTGDLAQGVTADNVGNVYIIGEFSSPNVLFGSTVVTKFTSSQYYNDIYLAKYDSMGTLMWAKREGGTSDNTSKGIATDPSGNVFIAGGFSSTTITFGSTILNNSSGGKAAYVVKYNSAGTVVWAKGGSALGTEAFGVTCDILGDAYATGNNSQDIFVVSYDASGIQEWLRNAGGTGNDCGYAIATAQNNVYVSGFFASTTCVFDTSVLVNSNPGLINMFIGRLDPAIVPTSIKENDTHFNEMNIYPNPTTGLFHLSLDKNITAGQVEVFNMMGEKVYGEPFDGQQKTINEKLSSGIYFVRVSGEGKVYTQKIVVE